MNWLLCFDFFDYNSLFTNSFRSETDLAKPPRRSRSILIHGCRHIFLFSYLLMPFHYDIHFATIDFAHRAALLRSFDDTPSLSLPGIGPQIDNYFSRPKCLLFAIGLRLLELPLLPYFYRCRMEEQFRHFVSSRRFWGSQHHSIFSSASKYQPISCKYTDYSMTIFCPTQ